MQSLYENPRTTSLRPKRLRANNQRTISPAENSQRVNRNSSRKTVVSKINVPIVGNIDYSISVTVSLLVLIGIVMVFSSSYYTASLTGDPFQYFRRQAMAAVMGFCAMYIMANLNYQYLKRLSIFLYLAANVLLVVVQIVSPESSGPNRWLYVPMINLSFQPSEVAKAGVILFLSAILSNKKNILKSWLGFIVACFVAGATCLLVAWGDFSTAIILAVIGFGIIFIASPYTMKFIVMGLAAAGGLVSYLIYGGDFRSARFHAWLDPYSVASTFGWQIRQSLYAIGSGGFFGLGLGQSRQKLGFIPEAHNDIIFSVIVEELGFMGATLILIFFAIVIIRGIRAAIYAVDTFGSLVASGIVLMIGSQVVINVGVVTNSIPNTGVTLPFISYGGTSLAITMFLIGILLNISRQSKI